MPFNLNIFRPDVQAIVLRLAADANFRRDSKIIVDHWLDARYRKLIDLATKYGTVERVILVALVYIYGINFQKLGQTIPRR